MRYEDAAIERWNRYQTAQRQRDEARQALAEAQTLCEDAAKMIRYFYTSCEFGIEAARKMETWLGQYSDAQDFKKAKAHPCETNIGAVLAYSYTPKVGIGTGSNAEQTQVAIFLGDPEKAWTAMNEFCDKLVAHPGVSYCKSIAVSNLLNENSIEVIPPVPVQPTTSP